MTYGDTLGQVPPNTLLDEVPQEEWEPWWRAEEGPLRYVWRGSYSGQIYTDRGEMSPSEFIDWAARQEAAKLDRIIGA